MMSKYTPYYEVTRDGRVFSILYNWRGYGKREMKLDCNSYGYLRIRLTIDKGQRKSYMVHRLVALHYLKPCPSIRHEIRHLDGNKANNNVSNLRWGTKQDNANDREKHGFTSRGLKHSIAIKKGLAKNE